MSIEEKEVIVAALKGCAVGFHNPQHFEEGTLVAYRVTSTMIVADVETKEGKVTLNATLLFTRQLDAETKEQKIVPIYGDEV